MKKKSRKGKASFSIHDLKIIAVLLAGFFSFFLYLITLRPNASFKTDTYHVYIPPKWTSDQLADHLRKKKIIRNGLSLKVLSSWMSFTPPEEGGIFIFEKGWNNYQLISNIQDQSPIEAMRISIPAVRHRNSLLRIIARELGLNKDSLRHLMRDSLMLDKLKPFNKESIYCMFIPGNYHIPKNSNESEVLERMHEEFTNFWNDERLEKVEEIGLDPVRATILASIVYAETKNYKEMPVIAGVYLNRLKKKMRLESDPTLVYATGSFGSRRVYKNRRMIHPEYNTYTRKGLPPGPVYFPPVKAIDAVLNYEEHEYVYFCAKDDSSGCHNFASSYREHKINADRYRKFLNDRKIYK